MIVCLINNLYKPFAVGGAETVVSERAKNFLLQGDEVVIITLGSWQGYFSCRPVRTIEDKIIVYRFWAPNIFSYQSLSKHNFFLKLFWHFFDIFNYWSERILKNILLKEKPDLVETHNLMGLGVYKVSKVIKTGIKWAHYLHDVQLVEPSGVLPWNHHKDNCFQKIYSWIIKCRMGNPDIVISPSEFLKDFYQSRDFFKKSEWRMEKYNVESIKYKVSELKKDNSKTRFLFVGSLVEHKGLRVLMQAWHDIQNAELLIVGGGVLRTEVEGWAQNRPEVKVLGRKEGQRLEDIYKSCDILIFPSICLENRPTVILEAQKYGLYIVASDTGGTREIMHGYERGTLIVPQKVEDLTKALKYAIPKTTN